MTTRRPPKQFQLQREWDPAWEKNELRWIFHILDPDEAKLQAMADALATAGFRNSMFNEVPGVMILNKLARFDRQALDAEILRVHELCEQHGIQGLDDVDMGDPAYDDLSVN